MAANKKNLLFTDSINQDMAQMEKNRKAFMSKNGTYSASAWLEFATQFNAYMGHPMRTFVPITGKNFKI